jgi:TolA-binding protein
MNGRIVFLIVIGLLLPVSASAQKNVDRGDDGNVSTLLTRHQQRMDILEQGLKEIRGVVEKDLRELKIKVEQLGASSATLVSEQSTDMKALRAEMEKLTDMLAMTNRRMERTLEIASDTEFRLLRLEKRVHTLISLGGADAASAVVQTDTTAAQAPASVQMSRDTNSGVTNWSIEEGALNRELEAMAPNDGGADVLEAGTAKAANIVKQPNAANGAETAVEPELAQPEAPEQITPPEPQVLPAVAPEEQYRFALGRALQNDLELAERAFAEFREINAGHAREVDATYWLGRVQFMRGEYEKAALTFTEFNSNYPGDNRLVDTTMWIAESVSYFASPDQACVIYADLPKLLVSPPEIFTKKLAELSDAAKCKS